MKALLTFTRDGLCEYLGQGLSDPEADELLEYARRLKRIESSQLVCDELEHHLRSVTLAGEWLMQETEGADLAGAMIRDSDRRAELCMSEIHRRDRLQKFPPTAPLTFKDKRAEWERTRAQTVEIISSYTPLKKRGKEYVGFCIFHNDRRNPNLHVNGEKGLWYCFGCNRGGNVFDFVEHAEGRQPIAL